ncbi:HAMP domain-containing sensor histidine kinase [Aquirufa aurantiipilula]|uniref:histidine kinase n=1 Tax=Aquirufa aurantiipilula TaxID=2696561 RepID=A0ABT6BGZ1_9BACT|nr:HAMP domain-containing sensor histidine kinase [Aquirufa aurantiipilula]MBZ1326267.1 HAMP domain-containing histidine kinase [Aquirufa aurantiipilula]MDF5689554.1 HAMP domain-containing sensor histidine kinase [Aquirufa aurantiipilula]
MSIRQRILIYFSVLSITVVGVTFLLLFTVFKNYRKEEFQQRVKDHIFSTMGILAEVRELDQDIIQSMGELTVNKLFREKTLLFDAQKKLIYSSIDDTKIEFSTELLNELNSKRPIIETVEGDLDVVGVTFRIRGKQFYGISKAYDKFGHSKLDFLKNILWVFFVLISALILISSFILSKQITQPIIQMAAALKIINMETPQSLLPIPENKDEIYLLAQRFNELMRRLQNSFAFQKHAVHHISHELKTPIAILVSNLENLEKEKDPALLLKGIQNQKEDTQLLGEMINALLEIAKVETHANLSFQRIRLDEIVFDACSEAKKLYPQFKFDINIHPEIEQEDKLLIEGNVRLIQMAVQNLLLNCIHYSTTNKAEIMFQFQYGELKILFSNEGPSISSSEVPFLFQHFFRGTNSQGKRGFGLGLVLVNKIMQLHGGKIDYQVDANSRNVFSLHFPVKLNS